MHPVVSTSSFAKQKQPRGYYKRVQPSKVEAIGMMQIN